MSELPAEAGAARNAWFGPVWKLLLAFNLDLLLGEPPELWHPVCLMGKAVDMADWAFPARDGSPEAQRASGLVVALLMPAGTFLTVKVFLRSVPSRWRGVAEVALLASALAARSLYNAALDVERALSRDIDESRLAVSGMVGRDTAGLDGIGVVRATVESVAENANDGVVAPLFYAFIGGAPLALAYKMVNTLDSMIGYRDIRYRDFGRAAARLDDAAGFIPARMTAIAAAAASRVAGGSTLRTLWTAVSEGRGSDSPNAGICEAAFAGALGIRLGGPDHYRGELVDKPVLGRGFRQPEHDDIVRAARLMYAAATVFMAAGTMARWLVSRGGRG